MRCRYDTVRTMLSSGCTRADVAERFGIGQTAASDLIKAARAGVTERPRINQLTAIRSIQRGLGNKRFWATVD